MAHSKQVLALASLNVGHRRTVTPGQSRQMQNFAAVGQAWKSLLITDHATWQALANQMTHQTGLRTTAGLKQKRPMTAFQCFASLNATLLACGQAIITTAPDAPAKPAALPPVLLTASTNLGADSGALPFTLTLSVPSFSDTLQVYAAAPLLAGQRPEGKNSAIIGIFSGPFAAALDLAPGFNDKFGPLHPGQQVALILVPVSSQGFKGVPLSVTASITALESQAKRGSDTTRALKAA